MKLYICNRKAIKRIIRTYPNKEMEKLTEAQKIEELANLYISEWIKLAFCDGEDFYRDGYWDD